MTNSGAQELTSAQYIFSSSDEVDGEKMETIKWNYFQFRKHYGYSVFIRFRQDELNPKYLHLLNELGFNELSEVESKKIPLQKTSTRLLTIQSASARLAAQITGSDLLDKYGHESLSLQGQIPVYTYRRVGIMALPAMKNIWDLALHQDISHTDQMIGLRIILVRYLSQALSEQGVLCYWGTVKDETVIVMKQLQSFGEAVFIDTTKKAIFSNGGEIRLGTQLKILRKDKDVKISSPMNREEIISFLSVSTCLLSFHGISNAMKRAIVELSASTTAHYAASEGTINL